MITCGYILPDGQRIAGEHTKIASNYIKSLEQSTNPEELAKWQKYCLSWHFTGQASAECDFVIRALGWIKVENISKHKKVTVAMNKRRCLKNKDEREKIIEEYGRKGYDIEYIFVSVPENIEAVNEEILSL